MKTLITKSQRHLLWQDELGDDFLLTRFAEIFRFDETTLKLYMWSSHYEQILRKQGLISKIWRTDDGLTIAHAKISTLNEIVALNRAQKRLRKSYVAKQEKKLGHRILPYKPVHLYPAGQGEVPPQLRRLKPCAEGIPVV